MPWRSPCPVVLTIHDILYQHISDHSGIKRKLYNTLYKIQRGAMARKAACILTVSEYSRKDILNFYHILPNRIVITYNAVSERFHPNISTVDQEQIQKKYGLTAPYILNLSNFKPHKNPGILIEAFAQMPPSLRLHTKLVLAGKHNAFTNPLRHRVKILNLEKNILFPGIIEEEDLPGLYAGATIFAFPSTYEGFGLPPLEAMSCGIPVISSNATSLPEVIGQAGLLIAPNDINAWSNAFVQLLQDSSLQKIYSEQGQERAKIFSLEIIAQNILNALVKTAHNHLT
jgi:glycosyltransferase involved in cell wall biosynthesis